MDAGVLDGPGGVTSVTGTGGATSVTGSGGTSSVSDAGGTGGQGGAILDAFVTGAGTGGTPQSLTSPTDSATTATSADAPPVPPDLGALADGAGIIIPVDGRAAGETGSEARALDASPSAAICGDGVRQTGEACDCGNDPKRLPDGCKAVNGLFYGDGTGCSKTCTREPICRDPSGKTRACETSCGDGNIDPGEECDDGNQADGDGCSSTCAVEAGFACDTPTLSDATTCQSGSGQCLELPIVLRDFQPENVVPGGHPDFFFLGTKYDGSPKPTTICLPNSSGPAKGNDSTKRCWGIVADTLLNGKPQAGATKTCDCRFSDWNIANSGRIAGGYTQAANDSPLSDAAGGYQGGVAGATVNTTSTAGPYTGTLTGYTASTPGGPIWKGTTPAYKDANSLKQWFTDDSSVNKTFTAVLEMPQLGTNIYQYASASHLAQGGFFPLDQLNAAQATLCNLWPYWKHGNGSPIWGTTVASCKGDQYLFTPLATIADCTSGDTLDDGCWVIGVQGTLHDAYFTTEARYYLTYDGAKGVNLQYYASDDLFVFINGTLALDLGGIHQQLPGKITIRGNPGDAQVVEGGCWDPAGNIVGTTVGAKDCSPKNASPPPATTPDDFRVRTVPLGLVTGKTYEVAIFAANRGVPTESHLEIALGGYATKRSVCQRSP